MSDWSPALRLTALVIYTFGAFAYGGIALLWLKRFGRVDWPSEDARAAGCACSSPRRSDRAGAAIVVTSFVWFVLLMASTLATLGPGVPMLPLQIAQHVVTFAFPPLIMHVTSNEVASRRPAGLGAWRRAVWAGYAVSAGLCTWSLLAFFGVLPVPIEPGAFAGLAIGGLFASASIYGALVMTRFGQKDRATSAGAANRSMLALFGLTVVLAVLITLAYASGSSLAHVLHIGATSLPLAFLFVSTYFEARFEFYDIFVKRGLAVLLTIVGLTLLFVAGDDVFVRISLEWTRPWVFAVALLPVAMLLPRLYAWLDRRLDALWLGRQLTTVEAVKHFLSGLQHATSEDELVAEARSRLSAILHGHVEITLDGGARPEWTVLHEVPVRAGGADAARILLGARQNGRPYFSEDLTLVGSLADVFGSVLENVRLQQKKRDQEQRERELSLQASRSELKALRAQINPHFLFNALNAIAALIHRDPAQADRTVEQLSEVFRYVLRGSDTEWAVVEDEMEFVRAYLDVERARFGARLEVGLTIDDAARGARIPTMLLQTLVENAVKHGIAPVRGGGRIDVTAAGADGRLVLTVSDTGPGFEAPRGERATAAPARGGYGLRNVRRRLDGHFGDAATLEVSRREAPGLTVVRITMPLVHKGRAVQPSPAPQVGVP